MKTVKIVPIEYINNVWNKVEPYIANAVEYCNDELDTEHIRVYLVQGIYNLVVAVDENNEVSGAAVVEFVNYPKQRVAFVVAIGGNMISTKEIWDQFSAWLKSCGASKVRGAARESIARLWRRAFKFEQRYIIVEKDL